VSNTPTTATEATGLPARHARSYVKVLERLCGDADLPVAARDVLKEVASAIGCESATIRVYDWRGDFPCLAHVDLGGRPPHRDGATARRAAPEDEIASDDRPCFIKNIRDIVTGGRTDPSRPFFTSRGSFWTNSLGSLLAGAGLGAELGTSSRDVEGCESVAMAPIRSGDRIIGVVEALGREPGIFSPTDVEFLERVGLQLGGAIEAWWRHKDLLALAASFDDSRRGAESMLAIGQMLSTIAHDIKNPLAGMMLAAQRLKKALHALPGQGKLSDISEHLCVSINALSETTSKVSSRVRDPVIEMSQEDIHEVLDSATALSARRACDQEVKIVRDLAARATRVRGDAYFLRRALLNLITNALDAMPSGGKLFVSTRALEGRKIEVVIGDTGEGLSSGAVEMLFRPFVSTRPGGSGLGLPLARRIVGLHGGTVSLRTRSAGGTEAVVEIPLAATEAPE
jgi:signal transduction histidine kinase